MKTEPLSWKDSVEMGSARALACRVARPRATHERVLHPNHLVHCSTLVADRRGRRSAHARARVLPKKTESSRLRRSSGGFTLIELVISASLMAIILAGAYLCLTSGLASQKLIEARGEAVQSGRVAMALISADLRVACPLSQDIQFVGMNRMLGEVEADNLDFATHNYAPRRAGEGDFCEVSYFVNAEPESGKFSLWRRRDPKLDQVPLAGGNREEIVRGLQGLRFEYYDGFEWFDEWGDPDGRGKKQNSLKERPNLAGMPEAVRITLWIEPASRSSKKKSAETETAETPLVFQTVARLNLAGVSFGSAISGRAEDATKQPAEAAPNEASQ
jgi:type II secretion system protein J